MTSTVRKMSTAAVLLCVAAVISACTQNDKFAMEKMSRDVSEAKAAAESAAQSASKAADAAKAAQQAADQLSMTQTHATGKGMRNK